MSAFATQSEPSPEGQSVFGTKDPILATTLGNLGFQARHSIPMLVVESAVNLVNFVDNNTGRVEDLAHTEIRFEAEILDPIFGHLRAADVAFAHEIAKLAQKEETKEISGSEALKLKGLRERWSHRAIGPNGANMAGTLLWTVQKLYDQITNWLVICRSIKVLSENRLIEFSKQVYKGVAFAVEPLESEPLIQRRMEKMFKK